MDTNPAAVAPPGWYPDASGVVRWWTGSEWGPTAPTPAITGDSRSWAMLSHFGLFMLYFVGPLVIRLTVGRQQEFVRRHATEALNGQITFAIAWNLFLLPVVVMVASNSDGQWAWLVLGALAAFAWMIANSAAGAVHAYRGQPWRYRGSFRFVRGGF